MKVVFITASFEDALRSAEIQDNSHYPMGLGYLHSFLESKGHSVTTLFLNDYSSEECESIAYGKLEEIKPDYVGFQVLTSNRVCSFKMMERIYKIYPDTKIMAGGIHATIMYKQILEKYPFLTIVLGEGELTFSELIDKGEPSESIDGIAYNDNGRIITTRERELIEDLDALPFPKHEVFFNESRRCGCVLTSRGCPFACTFCCLCSITQRKVRFRSVKNVVDEIEFMINKFKDMESVWIHDDSFLLNNKRVIEFCDEIVRRGIKKEFICSGRMKPLSKEMIKAMEGAGFKNFLVGLESGAEEILRTSKKAIKKEDAINAFKLFAKSSIKIHPFLIIGLPGETVETIKETADLFQTLQKIKYVFVGEDLGLLLIYPGTEVYEIAKRKGFIDDSYWLTDKDTPIYTADNPMETLNEFKEILISHISLNRIFTRAGFAAQKDMIPLLFSNHDMRMKFINILLSKTFGKETNSRLKKFLGLDRKTRKARMAKVKKALGFASSLPVA